MTKKYINITYIKYKFVKNKISSPINCIHLFYSKRVIYIFYFLPEFWSSPVRQRCWQKSAFGRRRWKLKMRRWRRKVKRSLALHHRHHRDKLTKQISKWRTRFLVVHPSVEERNLLRFSVILKLWHAQWYLTIAPWRKYFEKLKKKKNINRIIS